MHPSSRLGLVCEGETQSSVICISDFTAPSLPRRPGVAGGVCTNKEEYLWCKYPGPHSVNTGHLLPRSSNHPCGYLAVRHGVAENSELWWV